MINVPRTDLLTLVTPASIRNSDHAAFLQAYNDLHIKVFRFFFNRMATEDWAADLTQQTFIRLWQFRHTLTDAYAMETQVFVIARTLLLNHFAKEASRKKVLAAQQMHDRLFEPVLPSPTTGFELSDHLRSAIDILPPVRKKVIVLKAFHDFNNREIARALNLSVKTVEDHITKAFRRMREVMTPLLILCLLTGL